MATPRIPNQRNQYNKLNERLARYVLAVQSIYDDLNARAAKLGIQSGFDGEGEFKWSDFPELRSKIEELQSDFVTDIGALIMRGTSEEWKNSNLLQDMIADKVIKSYTGTKNRDEFAQYYQTNSPQLKAFQQRKDRGLNLSAKLWEQSEEYKSELEDVLSVAIERGTDAVTLSKQVSKYLRDFDTFKADYKEKYGKATDVHDCEYRSVRLARSEINMAYRTAEQTRWQQFDFVVGYEIKLSGSHPKEDICDRLAGKYPKDFVWTGWHPNDICYCIPLLKTEEEFFATDDDKPSVNEVTDVPPQFKEWCTENWNRISDAEKNNTLPYFLKDNKEYYEKELSIQKAAELRHKKRDEDAIRKMWENRKKLMSVEWSKETLYDYNDYVHYLTEAHYFGVDTTDLEEYVRTGDLHPKEYEELLDSIFKKNVEEFHKRSVYRDELRHLLTQLNKENGIYQLEDVKDEISQFLSTHEIAGGYGSIKIGSSIPSVSEYRKFTNNIKKKIIDKSEYLQRVTGISPKLPVELYPKSAFLHGDDYVFDKHFIDLTNGKFKVDDKRTPEEIAKGHTSYYSGKTKTIRILDEDRNKYSQWYRRAVVYHEGGHNIDDLLNIRQDNEFITAFRGFERTYAEQKEYLVYARREFDHLDKNGDIIWRTIYEKKTMSRAEYLAQRCAQLQDTMMDEPEKIMRRLRIKATDLIDASEALSVVEDTLLCISKGQFGRGHKADYMSQNGNRMAEFVAHMFSNKYAGNLFVKKYLPDIYEFGIEFVGKL